LRPTKYPNAGNRQLSWALRGVVFGKYLDRPRCLPYLRRYVHLSGPGAPFRPQYPRLWESKPSRQAQGPVSGTLAYSERGAVRHCVGGRQPPRHECPDGRSAKLETTEIGRHDDFRRLSLGDAKAHLGTSTNGHRSISRILFGTTRINKERLPSHRPETLMRG